MLSKSIINRLAHAFKIHTSIDGFIPRLTNKSGLLVLMGDSPYSGDAELLDRIAHEIKTGGNLVKIEPVKHNTYRIKVSDLLISSCTKWWHKLLYRIGTAIGIVKPTYKHIYCYLKLSRAK